MSIGAIYIETRYKNVEALIERENIVGNQSIAL